MSTSIERENADLRWRMKQLERQIGDATREVSGNEAHEIKECQARHDAVTAALGERAPLPHQGETLLGYRRRLAGKLTQYSDKFKDSRFDSVPEEVLDVVEPELHEHARAAARNSAKVGEMVKVEERDSAGRVITKRYGDPMAWMQHFMSQGVSGSFVTPRQK